MTQGCLGVVSTMSTLYQHRLARLDWGPYAGNAASQPEAVFMGVCVLRSLHHLERGRRVCNGLSHASLQTVFSLRKLHTDLDDGRVDKHSFTIPSWSSGLFTNRCPGCT